MPAETPPKIFVADDERAEDHTHVLLITTGSVASIKVPLIVRELLTVPLNLNSRTARSLMPPIPV